MTRYEVNAIGRVEAGEEGMAVVLDRDYLLALQGLRGFSHLQILWWFSDFDTEEARQVLETPRPYRQAPEILGIFATRSPIRPNPLALTTVEVLGIDYDTGVISVPYIDAYDGSPVLDIKPYTPSSDRVEHPEVPAWCSHWPQSYEASEGFDWEAEFLF